MNFNTLSACMLVLAGMMFFNTARAAPTSQQIEPATIALGEAAQLTVTASGDSAEISPPMVPGLEFVAVGQSQRIETVNGVTHSTTSVTYQVTARQAGTFSIPAGGVGEAPMVLTVTPSGSSSPSVAHAASGSPTPTATGASADGFAFVHLKLEKHALYVGEALPIDIQVGVREGIVASLNGLPTLNGDAFTLNKLSSEPKRTEEIIGGKPFTIFTWRAALAAVKPGALALAMETPLTIRVRDARPNADLFGDSGLGDLFNDPFFQDFFGGSTEKEVSVRSSPASFTVSALPVAGRPADFNGAVGHFSIRSALSEDSAPLGDPLTLSLQISGEGNFDRVNTPMLHDIEHWKTYAPTAEFKPADDIGYQGQKTFRQPLIATQSGQQAIPELRFSWFDPNSQRYETAHSAPLTASIAAPKGGGSVIVARHGSNPSARPQVAAAGQADGLHADHLDTGSASATLLPDYYRPVYLAAPSALLVAFFGAFAWARRREQLNGAGAEASPLKKAAPLFDSMDQAAAANNPESFLAAARGALQLLFAHKWQRKTGSITPREIEQRLGANCEVSHLFRLADASAYSGSPLAAINFAHWKEVVRRQFTIEALS